MRKLLVLLTFVALILGGLTYYRSVTGSGPAGSEFQTEEVTRGDLLATITATGTVQPEDVIDVGTQVAGQIKEFGIDPQTKKPVDYSSHVEQGAVLAHIDDRLYKAKEDQSRAQVAAAKRKLEQTKAKVDQARAKVDQALANVKRSEADILVAKAKQDQSDRDWERARRLGPRSAISQTDYDIAQATFETNKATTAVMDAALLQTKAAVKDAEAAVHDAEAAVGDAEANVLNAEAFLKQDSINLDYCTIRSPVSGVIIDRRVTMGQTVQSSFNTPSLFLLARDLKRMKVWASVNEADIGQVRLGQKATFTVDTYGSEVFTGVVGLIRYNATMTQNVVTYTVDVLTDNTSGKLVPYMTANLKLEVGHSKDGALLVPNAALRWQPATQQIAPEARTAKGSKGGKVATDRGTVWVTDGDYVRPLAVKLGLSDGSRTEIVEGELTEGMALVVNDMAPGSGTPAGDGTVNPFAPPNPFGKGKKR